MVSGLSRRLSVQSSDKQSKSAFLASMDTLTSLSKQRGFIFPSSEIYNSISGFFDYGHLGVELKNNIKKVWWQDMVYRRADMIGMESSIISAPAVWVASGHIEQFSDPFVDCKESKLRFRADQVHWAAVELAEGSGVEGDPLLGYVCIAESQLGGSSKQKKKSSGISGEDIAEVLADAAARGAKQLVKQRLAALNSSASSNSVGLRPLSLRELTEAPLALLPLLPSPATGSLGTLTAPRQFNLMFQTSVGAVVEEAEGPGAGGKEAASTVAYLRPETAQGIFINFQNMQRASRLKVSTACPV
jgi:glycyl-tRNA synthetase